MHISRGRGWRSSRATIALWLLIAAPTGVVMAQDERQRLELHVELTLERLEEANQTL